MFRVFRSDLDKQAENKSLKATFGQEKAVNDIRPVENHGLRVRDTNNGPPSETVNEVRKGCCPNHSGKKPFYFLIRPFSWAIKTKSI